MHLDNPDALACQIINDIFDAQLPLRRNIFSDAHIEAAKKMEGAEENSDPKEEDNDAKQGSGDTDLGSLTCCF